MVRVLTIAVTALALLAVPASASTFSAQGGGTQATVTYDNTATTRLTIVRNGATLMDAAPNIEQCGGNGCVPSGFSEDPPLRVLDLDADGEPEVVLSLYSGGAHCCSIAQVYRLNAAANGYEAIEFNFADPGFSVKDLDADGRPEFLTRDDAFAYRFTAYAFSGLPVLILRYSATGFADVTNSYPALITKDARLWRGVYRHARKRKDRTQQGSAAAWAADEYRLGKRTAALTYLKAEVNRGHLRAHFVTSLDKFLRKRGY